MNDGGKKISGRGVGKLKSLERLILSGNLDDGGLAEIGALTKVTDYLSLSGVFSDVGLEKLHSLTELQGGLSLGSPNVSDAGLTGLLRKVRIKGTLTLANTPATDAVVDTICDQKALKKVILPSGVSQAARERLHVAVPDASINGVEKTTSRP